MTWTTTLLVLAAAALHAAWNAVVKSAGDRLMSVVALTAWAAVIVTPLLLFVPIPEPRLWPILLSSAVIHWTYTVLIAFNYDKGDMSRVYPIMRGAAPLIVAVITTLVLQQRLGLMAWAGVIVISSGILLLSLEHGLPKSWADVGLALMSAAATAAYTIVDGRGVQMADSPLAFALWLFWLIGAPLGAWALVARRGPFLQTLKAHWGRTFLAGAGSIASYGLALWAMTLSPIVLVAALRETSTLFGTLIAATLLKEAIGRARVAATVVIVAGAVLVRLA